MRKLTYLLLLLTACGNTDSDDGSPLTPGASGTPGAAATSGPTSGSSGGLIPGSFLAKSDAGATPSTVPSNADAGSLPPSASTSTDTSTNATPSAFPHFTPAPDAGQPDELLTYMAHLYGQPLANGTVLHTVTGVGVTNPSRDPTGVLLHAHLQGYSAPGSTSFQIPAGQTMIAPPLDLTFDFNALYKISAPVTASLALTLTAPGNAAPLDVASSTVLLYPKNTIFWVKKDAQGNTLDLRHTVAVFVTPHDQGRVIDQVLKEASAYSTFHSMIGYQYMAHVEEPQTWKGTAQPGYCQYGTTTLTAGMDYTISATSSCPACAADNGYLRVYTQADWQGARSKVLAKMDALGKGSVTFTPTTTDAYVVAVCSPSSAGGNRTVTFGIASNFTAASGAYDQAAAIFLALKARGINYVSVASDFFMGAQNVKYPTESLATKSANCIDGALIFASALESMGMRPGIVFVPGHATVAVLVEPDADPCDVENWLPIETTMLGSGTPLAAVEHDLETVMPKVKSVFAAGCGTYRAGEPLLVDIASMRQVGLRPAPL